jgi:hypothetical protein
MLKNKKRPTGTLLLAGLAAFAYYKYSKMSEDEKKKIVGDLKEKGKKFYDQNVPENIKSMFSKNGNQTASNQDYQQQSPYTQEG